MHENDTHAHTVTGILRMESVTFFVPAEWSLKKLHDYSRFVSAYARMRREDN